MLGLKSWNMKVMVNTTHTSITTGLSFLDCDTIHFPCTIYAFGTHRILPTTFAISRLHVLLTMRGSIYYLSDTQNLNSNRTEIYLKARVRRHIEWENGHIQDNTWMKLDLSGMMTSWNGCILRNCLQDKVSFGTSRAWQIVLIFNTVVAMLWITSQSVFTGVNITILSYTYFRYQYN